MFFRLGTAVCFVTHSLRVSLLVRLAGALFGTGRSQCESVLDLNFEFARFFGVKLFPCPVHLFSICRRNPADRLSLTARVYRQSLFSFW